jgi:hypothetical protein
MTCPSESLYSIAQPSLRCCRSSVSLICLNSLQSSFPLGSSCFRPFARDKSRFRTLCFCQASIRIVSYRSVQLSFAALNLSAKNHELFSRNERRSPVCPKEGIARERSPSHTALRPKYHPALVILHLLVVTVYTTYIRNY